MPSDMPRHVRWSDVPAEDLTPLLQRQFVSSESLTVARIHLKKGSTVPAHAHHNEQIAYILSGALRFTIDPDGEAKEVIVRGGELLVLPPHVPHAAEALEDTLNIDIFSPPRQDWIDGDDAYLRNQK
jgi:quercetin dioxygenase-like cupin family protein